MLGAPEIVFLVLLVGLPVAAAAIAWRVSGEQGRERWLWVLACLVFPPALLVLMFLKPRVDARTVGATSGKPPG